MRKAREASPGISQNRQRVSLNLLTFDAAPVILREAPLTTF